MLAPSWPAVPALGFRCLARLFARRSVHGCICQPDTYRKSPPPCCKRHGSLGSAVGCVPVAAAAPHCWASTALRPMRTAHGIRAAIHSTKQSGGRRAAVVAAGAGCTAAGSGRPESSAPAARSSRWRMQSRSTKRFSQPTSAMSTRQVLRRAGVAAACAHHWVEEHLRASPAALPACIRSSLLLYSRTACWAPLLPLERLAAPVRSCSAEPAARGHCCFLRRLQPAARRDQVGWLAGGRAFCRPQCRWCVRSA